jgi:integrase
MATIIKNKNATKKYTVRYYHDGRQRERSFVTAREAGDFKAKFDHDSRAGIFVDPKVSGEKFSAVAERWLARHPGTPNTLRAYESALRLHVLPEFGHRGLNSVAQDREGVEQFLRSTLPAKGLKTNTIRVCFLVLRSVIQDSVKTGRLSTTRLRGIKAPPPERRADIPFATHEQIAALAQGLPEPYGYTVYLMRGLGLRAGEALGVTMGDFLNGTVRLSRQMALAGDLVPLKHRHAGDYRDIPVPQYVYKSAPGDWGGFAPVNRRTYQEWFNRARDASGLPSSFTPHTLRHIFASVCLAGGIPITDLSAWLGHRNIQTTYSIYGHLVPASWDRARGILDTEWNT